MTQTNITFAPRLLKASSAAQYLGFSESKLRSLPIPTKKHGGNRLYDRRDLDAYADDLPYESADWNESGENTCDGIFGAKG